jgi:putative transposase
MSDYRRVFLPGGTYFFTVVLQDRGKDLLVRHIEALRDAVGVVRRRYPFEIIAWVVLPDHLHCMWKLPEGDTDYSNRWRLIKTIFSKKLPRSEFVSVRRKARGERGVWQRRYWEHTIVDEKDLNSHLDYVHINPLKHGLVQDLVSWPYSTFHRFVRDGVYSIDWNGEGLDFEPHPAEFL